MTATVLTNAAVLTCDRNDTVEEALAFVDGRLTAVGSDEDVRRTADPDAPIVDLDRATILPAHVRTWCSA